MKRAYAPCQLDGNQLFRSQLFATIPPERIGLKGEFDYYGLSKRVSHYLRANVDDARYLKVRQRGRVVVLSGHLGSPYQLRQIIDLARSVHGVDEVETSGIAVAEAC
ncbi:BON domain-containing protein [Leptothoe sp. PORK10 BA2]|nr:BON domain-containing protein [Leptothoe sp. PORK10 BA2]